MFAHDLANAQSGISFTIAIRPMVNIGSSEHPEVGDLTLSEIIDTKTIAAAQRENVVRLLSAVALSDRPLVGEGRTFTREGLETVVAEASRRLEAAGYSVEWRIPGRSHVLRRNEFSQEALLSALRVEFERRCERCEVVFRRMDLPKVVSADDVASWRLLMRAERPRGSFAIPIEFDLVNGKKRTTNISGQVEFYAMVPVATRALPSGAKLEEELKNGSLTIERRNITHAMDVAASSEELAAGVAARALSPGEVIWRGVVRKEQVVRFGDPIRVRTGGETWSVSIDGIAQGAAAIGETVRVRVGSGQKVISGVVKERGLVEIE
ncbi:MAG: flagellar basal body P-ring formation chaperone FlgA [Bdellovibrionales bacterium]|jgi:flagella basal body P-ring formation protein FlgA|nr:flagellar basal body P-ring formation chaperone FlgA [Bdellovibrionales bacterium]